MAKTDWKKLDWLWLVSLLMIFGVGFFLRLAWLGKYPSGFHSQEALLGYRGKLLSTGLVDETGRKLPLIFTSFQGYQWPISSYLVALSIAVFGLKEWAVRLPFALFGCLALVAFFGLSRLLFKDKNLAFWATLVMAFSPWQIFLSRTASDFGLFLNLFLLGAWLFLLLGKKRKFRLRKIFLSLVLILAGLSFFSYFRSPGIKQDFINRHLSFFTDPSILNSINQMRGESLREGNPFLGKIFYNKTFYLVRLTESFLNHFKPQFYFAAGDANPLHGLSNFGPILVIFLPFFLIGLWSLFQKGELAKKKSLLIAWFLIGIIPSALSYPLFNQEKLILVFPVLAILIGYAIAQLKRNYLVILAILIAFNLDFVLYDGISKEPYRAQKDWQLGTKQLAGKALPKREYFDKILITDHHSPDLGPQLLFYADYPLERLWQDTNLTKGQVFYHQWISRLDKIQIGQIAEWQIEPGEKALLMVTPTEEGILNHYRILAEGDRPSEKICYQITDQVLDLNGKPIYLMAEGISENCLLKTESER